jgi:transcriptional regulator with XRE-family HTH domain
MMKKMSKILQDARHESGLTQAEVAKKASITVNTYARIERGEQRATVPTLKKIAKALDLDLAKLMDAWS